MKNHVVIFCTISDYSFTSSHKCMRFNSFFTICEKIVYLLTFVGFKSTNSASLICLICKYNRMEMFTCSVYLIYVYDE